MGLFVIGTVDAELFVRGTDSLDYQLIYDDDLNITWYDYSNAINSWWNQMEWAEALTIDFGDNNYDDWRLPFSSDNCIGYGCFGSEMGHLSIVELDNPSSGGTMNNTGDFQNLITQDYWEGTEYSLDTTQAKKFDMYTGSTTAKMKGLALSALAVREGDVSLTTVVPEPISSILFLTGGGVIVWRKLLRQKAHLILKEN